MNKILQFFKDLSKSRTLKYGTNSIILIAVVVAIAVIINLLVGMISVRIDLTPNKLFSISDETVKILNELDKDVVIYGLFDEAKIKDSAYSDVVEILSHYDKHPRIKVEYVDPERNPGFINELDPENLKDISNNDFVVKCGDKMKVLSYYDLFSTQFNQYTWNQDITGIKAEQGFTGAIRYVSADVTPVVYFMAGHGERDVDREYTVVKEYLEKNNYEVKLLNLFTMDSVPEDAEMVIVASPTKDLSSEEAYKFKKYLDDGGKAVFMFDSLESNPQFTEFDKILMDYGVSLNYDKVKENDDSRRDPTNPYAILLDIQSSSIVPEKFNTIFTNSRSINILRNQKEYITVTSLAKTSDKAVGEQIDKTKGENIAGPLDLAVAVEDKGGTKVSKILVIGNGSFISDNAIDQYGPYSRNGLYFFLYSLNWLQDKKDEVIIAPKTYETPVLTISAKQASITGIAVVVVLPLLVLGTGLYVFLRRRHL